MASGHEYRLMVQVNICRQKQLTNMRSAGKDDNTNVTPAVELTLGTKYPLCLRAHRVPTLLTTKRQI
eukprot:1378761-Pleurochrysis_carterae.AAC.1